MRQWIVYFVIIHLIYACKFDSFCNDRCNHQHCKFLPDDDKCGPVSHSPRVVGGKDATLGEFPWIAIIYLTEIRQPMGCVGSIITSSHVITAAHCIILDPTAMYVRVGEHDLNTTKDCTADGICAPEPKDIYISQYYTYEGFDLETNNDDIALLRLKSSIEFNSFIAPICLPILKMFQSDEYLETNSTFKVAGWGNVDPEGLKLPSALQTVTLPFIPKTQCQFIYQSRRNISEKQLCAGGVKGEDSCNGDSGGPLMGIYSVNHGPQRYFLIGIISIGPSKCGNGLPAIYTKVSQYLQWILDYLGK